MLSDVGCATVSAIRAVLLQDHTKAVLWPVLMLMTGFLVEASRANGLGTSYYLFSVSGSSVSLGLIVWYVELQDSRSCWWWFSNGSWWTGDTIMIGLLVEYLKQVRF